MSIPPDINSIFDINDEVYDVDEFGRETDMDVNDEDIDLILDATDGVRHMWEGVEDDNTITEESKLKKQRE